MAITVSDALRLRLLSRPPLRGEGGYAPDPISEKKKEKINPTERLFSFFFLFLEDKR
jgi:hypothetical protein